MPNILQGQGLASSARRGAGLPGVVHEGALLPTLLCSLQHYKPGMDLLGGAGGCAPPSPGQRGCQGVLFFMIKQKIMRYSNLSNNMMINEL
jgi:hypothetical protein